MRYLAVGKMSNSNSYWMNVLNRNPKTVIIFPRSDWKVEIPFPKIVKTLPWTYKKLHYKEEPYRES